MTDEGRGSEYQRRVLALDHSGLLELWRNLRAGVSSSDWPAGVLLEYLLLRAFQLEGAEVTWPYEVRRPHLLEQIDGAVYFDGVSCLLECKAQSKKLDAVPIIKLKAQLMRRPRSTMGAVFSISGFSRDATALVQMLMPTDVLLWRGNEIERALWERGLCRGMRRKLRYAMECGFSDLDLTEEEDFQ